MIFDGRIIVGVDPNQSFEKNTTSLIQDVIEFAENQLKIDF